MAGKIMGIPPKISQYGVPPPLPKVVPAKMPVPRGHHVNRLATVGAAVIMLLTYCALPGPGQSVRNLTSAMERHDRETVAQYLDAEQLAVSLNTLITEMNGQQKDIIDQLAGRFVNQVITPELVVSVMSGQTLEEAFTESVGRTTDKVVDGGISLVPSATPVHGNIAKLFLCVAGEHLIKETVAEADRVKVKPEDLVYSRKFESTGRFIIIRSDKSGKIPTIASVFKRHGLSTWKFAEVRLLSQARPGSVYAAK
jgi:hypothetical protein